MFSQITQFTSSFNNFRKYLVNTGWGVFEKLIRSMALFIVGLFMARCLGPNDFGIFNLVLSLISLFMSVSYLGLDQIIVRELVSNPSDENSILGSSFFLRVVSALIAGGLTILTASLLSIDDFSKSLVFMAVFLFLFHPFLILDKYFEAKVQLKFSSLAKICHIVLISIFRVYLIIINANVVWFVFSIVLDYFLFALCLIFQYRVTLKQKMEKWTSDLFLMKNLFKDSWPLMCSGTAVMIYMKIDQIMIPIFREVSDLGVYSVAVRLSEVWYFLPVVIVGSLFPAIINAKKTSKELYSRRLQQLYGLMIVLALLVAIPITFLGTQMVLLLFGEEYLLAGYILKVHVWAGIFVFIGVAISQYLVVEKYTKISLFCTLMGAVINIVLNFFLIPQFGILGAAITTVISYAVSAFSVLFFKRTREQGVLIFKLFLFRKKVVL